ncbi:hypothetical protein THAOC_01656, partial [Thalassiosira oceanica]
MASDNAAESLTAKELKEAQNEIKSRLPSGTYVSFQGTFITRARIRLTRRIGGETLQTFYSPPLQWYFDNDDIIGMLHRVLDILSEVDFDVLTEMPTEAISVHIDTVDDTLLPSNEVRSLNRSVRGVIAKLARETRGSGKLCDSVIEEMALALRGGSNANSARSEMKTLVLQGCFVEAQPFFQELDQFAIQTFSSMMAGDKTDNFA